MREGDTMPTLLLSYARDDRVKVEDLTQRLPQLGYSVWMDNSLRGGQDWWDEICTHVRDCDAFVAIVSEAYLSSTACKREREYAVALGKPLLPIGVEPITQAMPRELAARQIVDYATPNQDAAFALVGALTSLPPAPPLPANTPPPPAVPLSYQTGLTELLNEPELTKDQQRHVLDALEEALRSRDDEERTGAQHLLVRMNGRGDLFADVDRRIQALLGHGSLPPAAPTPASDSRVPAAEVVTVTRTEPHLPLVPPPRKRSKAVTGLAVIGFVFVLLLLLGACGLFFAANSGPDCYTDPYGAVWCE
jgi:nucleotide-binding universal stress UspA family protein